MDVVSKLQVKIDYARLQRLIEDGFPWIQKIYKEEKDIIFRRMKRTQNTFHPEILVRFPLKCGNKQLDQGREHYCCFSHMIDDTWFSNLDIAKKHILNPDNNPTEAIHRWLMKIAEWKNRTDWQPKELEKLTKGIKFAKHALTTELLLFLNPHRFWLWNAQFNKFVNYLEKANIINRNPKNIKFEERYYFYEKLLDDVKQILEQIDRNGFFERPLNYFHADRVVSYVNQRVKKIWLVATGENGKYWEAFKNHGCIGISWKEAAKRIENYDFSQLDKDTLKAIFHQAYPKEGRGGWYQVCRFMGNDLINDMQPGEIVIARKGQRTILGIGVIQGEVIPPLSPDNPFQSDPKHSSEYIHVRYVDWRILKPIEFSNLPQNTLVRMNKKKWDLLMKRYDDKGINLQEALLASTKEMPISLEAYFQSKGYRFDYQQITSFYAALKTKGLVILSGLSGTGKTKLALWFVDLFSQIKTEEEIETPSERTLILEIKPYMLKYRRFNIPVTYYELLPLLNPDETRSVEVELEGNVEVCKLRHFQHPTNPKGNIVLLLKGDVGQRFVEHFREGDHFYLEPIYDEDGNLRKLRIKKPRKRTKSSKKSSYLFLSVRPDWRDGKALLGYYNPLTERYESTPLLRFIIQAYKDYDKNREKAQPYFIILDEMNLSHVEYYFADFLSVLESGHREDGLSKEPIRLFAEELKESLAFYADEEIPPQLYLPPNLYIIGTVNIDETTYMFSPKVLDRFFTLEFRDVTFRDYPVSNNERFDDRKVDQLRGILRDDLADKGRFCSTVNDKTRIREAIKELGDAKDWIVALHERLFPYDLHFGFRVMDEIALFVQNATHTPDGITPLTREEAIDWAVLMKVLPKFHGPRQRLEKPLIEVIKWCLNTSSDVTEMSDWKSLIGVIGDKTESIRLQDLADILINWDSIKAKFRFPQTALKALRMMRQLIETGFTSFSG